MSELKDEQPSNLNETSNEALNKTLDETLNKMLNLTLNSTVDMTDAAENSAEISKLEDDPSKVDNNSDCSSSTTEASIKTLDFFDDTIVFIETEEQFIQRTNECMTIYDFSVDSCSEGKKEKENALKLLVRYIKTADDPFTGQMHDQSIAMFKKNCFRSFTSMPSTNEAEDDPEENEAPVLDPAWDQLKLVYDFFLAYVELGDFQSSCGGKHIDKKFIIQLLSLFNSENLEEREALRTLLYRIYTKFTPLRLFIRQEINHIFISFVQKKGEFNGISELLNFLGAVINGFAMPLKEEHLSFLQRVLMPLHKPGSLHVYHLQLTYCLAQFVDKDPKLSPMIIKLLLKYWPHANYLKELLFLSELDEFLDIIDADEFERLKIPIFKRMALCISSSHSQVAARALAFWSNFEFMVFVNANIAEALPILLPPLREKTEHWNSDLCILAKDTLQKLENADPGLFDSYEKNLDEQLKLSAEHEEKRKKRWELIHQKAKSNSKDVNSEE